MVLGKTEEESGGESSVVCSHRRIGLFPEERKGRSCGAPVETGFTVGALCSTAKSPLRRIERDCAPKAFGNIRECAYNVEVVVIRTVPVGGVAITLSKPTAGPSTCQYVV